MGCRDCEYSLFGMFYTGAMIGNVIAMPVSGLLCQHGFDEGWGSVFYVTGLKILS